METTLIKKEVKINGGANTILVQLELVTQHHSQSTNEDLVWEDLRVSFSEYRDGAACLTYQISTLQDPNDLKKFGMALIALGEKLEEAQGVEKKNLRKVAKKTGGIDMRDI